MDSRTVIVDNADTQITYSPGWKEGGSPNEYKRTTTNAVIEGASFSFNFTGKPINGFTLRPSVLTLGNRNVHYSLRNIKQRFVSQLDIRPRWRRAIPLREPSNIVGTISASFLRESRCTIQRTYARWNLRERRGDFGLLRDRDPLRSPDTYHPTESRGASHLIKSTGTSRTDCCHHRWCPRGARAHDGLVCVLSLVQTAPCQ